MQLSSAELSISQLQIADFFKVHYETVSWVLKKSGEWRNARPALRCCSAGKRKRVASVVSRLPRRMN